MVRLSGTGPAIAGIVGGCSGLLCGPRLLIDLDEEETPGSAQLYERDNHTIITVRKGQLIDLVLDNSYTKFIVTPSDVLEEPPSQISGPRWYRALKVGSVTLNAYKNNTLAFTVTIKVRE